jgi:hypothetical protein
MIKQEPGNDFMPKRAVGDKKRVITSPKNETANRIHAPAGREGMFDAARIPPVKGIRILRKG